MLVVSDAAYARLADLLSEYPDKIAARIVRKGNRMSLRRGQSRPGDKMIEHEGRVVLLLAKSLVDRLSDRVLDVRKTADGPKLGLRRAKT